MGIFVKDFVKKIKNVFSKKIRDAFSDKTYIPICDRKHLWIVSKFLLLTGQIYYLYKIWEEDFKVFLYNFRDSCANVLIFYEIGKHSKKLFFLVILTFLIPSSIYLFLQQYLSFILTSNSIISLLLAYFAGITALLGIIFAFYSVGFQIATSKYSSEVSDYINQEKVGKFFFNLLVFAGLFPLTTLIVQYGVIFPLTIPFLLATILVVFSLLGILIFKDDYITKLKPRNIFNQIYNENIRAIRQVNQYNTPLIKDFSITFNPSVASLKLHLLTWNSWSIVMTHQKNVERRLKIHSQLFRDLIREGSIDDASYGIVIMGYFLVAYIEIKHFIDIDRPWWFPQYQEAVSADNMSMFPIKANYEAQGIGRFGVTKSDTTWLEDKVIKQLEDIQNDAELTKYPKIVNALINTYETIIAGRFEKTKLGMQKTVHGVYELQDFELTERVYNKFLALGIKITDESVKGTYINTLGAIKTVIVDGFSLRSFPGKLDDWKPIMIKNIEKILRQVKIYSHKNSIVELKLPKYFYELLVDYVQRLSVEEFVEGKWITPEAWLIDDFLINAKNKEKEIQEKFLFSLLDGMITVWEKVSDASLKSNLNVIVYGIFNQLISANKWEYLEKIITKYKAKLFVLLVKVDTTNFLGLELREPIEFGVFNALIARNKVVFDFYNGMFALTQLHLSSKIDHSDLTQVLKLARRPMMLGALAYLVSELDDDFHYVKEVTRAMETLFPNANLGNIFELTKDMKAGLGVNTLSQIIYEEANRYRPYYRNVINSIFELPPDWITRGSSPLGMSSTKTVKHKSSFIRNFASYDLADMEECFDGYIEWLKKRKQK